MDEQKNQTNQQVNPAMMPTQEAVPTPPPQQMPQPVQKSKKGWIVLVIVLLLVIAGLVAYIVLSKDDAAKDSSTKEKTSQTNTTSEIQPKQETTTATEDSNQGKYFNDRFSLELPEGWIFEKTTGNLAKQENETYTFTYDDDYVTLNLVKLGKDAAGDVNWTYELGSDRKVKLKNAELTLCTLAENSFCTVGDGKLTIFVEPQTISFNGIPDEISASFYVGNLKTEDTSKVKIGDYKSILNSVVFKM